MIDGNRLDAGEAALWDGVVISALRAISNNPAKHQVDGAPCRAPEDVARLAAQVGDAAVRERRARMGEVG